MREIKFRAWSKYQEKWKFFLVPTDFFISLGVETDYQHWSEFTGLRDKNGKEIYEGDIVSCMVKNHYGSFEPHEGVVKWNEKWAGFEVSIDDARTPEFHFHVELPNEPMKIIGNIYENPELLKV